ncbi:MAG: hypothetical protein JSW71_05795 [Gemmatimonadota bacterium]|nr:MAG: hypothetical protein JSW71_05795 [Gemmatimonadota bacterium]
MSKTVGDLMLPLSEYAVVDEDATILDALVALDAAQAKLPPGRQPHRAVLVRDRTGEIAGKLHHFAFLRAFAPERKSLADGDMLDRAGVGDDLLQQSIKALDILTSDLVNVCVRARSVAVRDVCSRVTASIDEHATLVDSVSVFLSLQTLLLLVRRAGQTVGVLRLSDLFDELARQVRHDDCHA